MAYPVEILSYAKSLYLAQREDGRHKYSLRDISEMIRHKFKDAKQHPDEKLISSWANAVSKLTGKSWADEYMDAIQTGKVNVETKVDFHDIETTDQKLRKNIERITMLRASTAIKATNIVSKFLKNEAWSPSDGYKPKTLSEALKIGYYAERIFTNIGIDEMERYDQENNPVLNNVIELVRAARAGQGRTANAVEQNVTKKDKEKQRSPTILDD
jgi:hypothetical protein